MRTWKMAKMSWKKFVSQMKQWEDREIIMFAPVILVPVLAFEFVVLMPLTFVVEKMGLLK